MKGKFKSERQRRWMWATHPEAAHKWAHNRDTSKSDWGTTGKLKAKARKKR